ncbi:MAG: hypothetical protein DRI57_14635 [Deltaproteobacteria bacterium]|nr:MAG: hypothetical protein DRI57_14635 [Deltaproteobacteria bacterium]
MLLDQISTSSQKFQDNLFEKNAVPPEILVILARSNTDGIVERYIYQKFRKKQHQILKIGKILDTSTAKNFDLDLFFSEFTSEKGIRRSIDKVFEIVVYALFNTLVRHLKVTITVSADPDERELLQGF